MKNEQPPSETPSAPQTRWVGTCDGCDGRIEIVVDHDDDRPLEWTGTCPYCDTGDEVLFVLAGDAPSAPREELRAAVEAWLMRYDAVIASDEYKGFMAMGWIHGGNYRGENWNVEFDAVRAALSRTETPQYEPVCSVQPNHHHRRDRVETAQSVAVAEPSATLERLIEEYAQARACYCAGGLKCRPCEKWEPLLAALR